MKKIELAYLTIWPSDIHQWLLSEPEFGLDISALKRRRNWLAYDKRLFPVPTTLLKLAPQPSRVRTLLEVASGLPESFAYFKDKKPDLRAVEIQELGKATRRYLRQIASSRDVIERYFEPLVDDANEAMRFEKDCVDDLVAQLEQIAKYAEMGMDYIAPDTIPKVSRKKNVENAEKVFCVRQLSRTARVLFKKPLHKEVGLIMTVCLNLSVVIDPDEVRDLCRES